MIYKNTKNKRIEAEKDKCNHILWAHGFGPKPVAFAHHINADDICTKCNRKVTKEIIELYQENNLKFIS